jgi:hypothetical protein
MKMNSLRKLPFVCWTRSNVTFKHHTELLSFPQQLLFHGRSDIISIELIWALLDGTTCLRRVGVAFEDLWDHLILVGLSLECAT